ncbi:hotdog fold thioesterase [Alicyclobacillus dauci]|uniref:Hotdog fold thioesterase n=1 Tax=Alicyclobacillus dauci TaxID=1475485 RepID=A0ABY6ZAQ2_9BACL|nr:hotdog fold thioesterase [Alicyclobacillus dauci]WAH39236.1 hotdog fold thioesterase [Alicyclobacillus dauci]
MQNTLMDHLGMKIIEATPDKVVITMPVDERTHQPMGLLHGGASVALAESAASIASHLNLQSDDKAAVGLEINANHVRSVREGTVTATATPVHRGATTMVWDIRITDERNHLVCISRCTVAIVTKRNR